MICPKCGANNLEGAVVCSACGNSLTSAPPYSPTSPSGIPGQAPTMVPNYLVPAILVTIFCCLPLGIPALIFSSQVNTKLALGDYNGALESSKKAKLWTMIAAGVGVVGLILYIIVMVIFGAIGAANS